MLKPNYITSHKDCVLSERPGSAAIKLVAVGWVISTPAGDTLATGTNAGKAWANAYYALSRCA